MKTDNSAPFICLILLLLLGLACGQSARPVPAPPELQAPENLPVEPAHTPTNPPPEPTSLQSSPPQSASELAPGDFNRTIDFGSKARSYLLHIPPGYDPAKPAALVLVYHGISLDAEEMVRITGFSQQSDESGFLVVYPNGTGARQSWNGGMCCGEAAQKKTDDVGFTRALIDQLSAELNVDQKRVYATGFSNGAFMAYRLACDLADRIAAIAPVGAAPGVQSCDPARPVPLIHFHGDHDRLNPYEGVVTSSGLEFIGVEQGIADWVELNGCSTIPEETTEGYVVHRVYGSCEAEGGSGAL